MDFNCRESLLYLFKNAEEEGLNPTDFEYKKLKQYEQSLQKLTNQELVTYDFLLTENLNRYIYKVAFGSLNPKELYEDWDLKPNNGTAFPFLISPAAAKRAQVTSAILKHPNSFSKRAYTI